MQRVCGFRTTDRYDSLPNPEFSSPHILLSAIQLSRFMASRRQNGDNAF
jgi:hypothetical protein